MRADTEAWVREFLSAAQEPGDPPYEDLSQASPSPDGSTIACTVMVRVDASTDAVRRIALVDARSGAHRLLDLGGDCFGARWSPSGSQLAAVLVTADGDRPVVVDVGTGTVVRTVDLDGSVEHLHWSPDGSRLALQVAEPGAELSDLYGSGVVGGGESWRPRVLPATLGRRSLVVWDPGAGTVRTVGDLNVWEVSWRGPDRLLAVASEGAGEDDWYGAALVEVDAATGEASVLHQPTHQLSRPCASPSGDRWAALSGAASDRDLLAGELIVGPDGKRVRTARVHVTDAAWLDEERLLVTGLRRFATVVAVVDVASGGVHEAWSSDEHTTGRFMPELAGMVDGAPVLVRERHDDPPTLGLARPDGFEPLLRVTGPGVDHRAAHAGRRTSVSWRSDDGTEVLGQLTVPDSPTPHALVVDVHGGPIHAVRSTWAGRDPYVSLLVARGYAVLQPNPRGSTGRGAAYAETVIGDMGGADVDDILSGVRHLVDFGAVDPDRLGVTGVSYGGFMTAWLPSRTAVFKAGVSRSPCTDWNLMYLTSNIREFVRIFVDGQPGDPGSQYRTRSPLQHADRMRTPLLLTTGAHDLACPTSQAQSMYTALVERGVEAELVVYPEEGHDVKRFDALVDQCARMIGWFERFMPADGVSAED